MKYYLHYVESCSPKLKLFKTKKAVDKFVKEFKTNNEDNWLDFIVEGKIIPLDTYYGKRLKETANGSKTRSRKA